MNRNFISLLLGSHICGFVDKCTLDPAYNKFGYNENLAITSRFLYSKIIDSNVKKQPLAASNFFYFISSL